MQKNDCGQVLLESGLMTGLGPGTLNHQTRCSRCIGHHDSTAPTHAVSSTRSIPQLHVGFHLQGRRRVQELQRLSEKCAESDEKGVGTMEVSSQNKVWVAITCQKIWPTKLKVFP